MNPHVSQRWNLNPVRLPVPPLPHATDSYEVELDYIPTIIIVQDNFTAICYKDWFCMSERWLGWMDLNHRMSESESDALPLGYTPIFLDTNCIILKFISPVKQIYTVFLSNTASSLTFIFIA